MLKFTPKKGKFLFSAVPFHQGSAADFSSLDKYNKLVYGNYTKLGPPAPTIEELAKLAAKLAAKLHDEDARYYYGDYYHYYGDYYHSYSGRAAPLLPTKDGLPAKVPVAVLGTIARMTAMVTVYYGDRPVSNSVARNFAERALWEEAAAEMVVRHPDAKAVIALEVTGAGRGKFIVNADDTRSPGVRQLAGFHMPWQVTRWPGKQVAKELLTCMWMVYLAHEASELVSNKTRLPDPDPYNRYAFPDKDRVINVHQGPSYYPKHWRDINAVMYGDGITPEIRTLTQVYEADDATRRWHAGVTQGEQEVLALVSAYQGTPMVPTKVDPDAVTFKFTSWSDTY